MKKIILQVSLYVYAGMSFVCFLLLLVPATNQTKIFHAWLFCTYLFEFGLGLSMLLLSVQIIRLVYFRKQIKK